MKTKKIVSVLVIAIVAVMMIGTVIANDQFVDAASKKKVKVTYNANGGKIGSKKFISTNIKKGTKLKKFPSTPKRAGYAFKGWYTKKTGGKKVNVNTKPSKSTILYAQWKKVSSSGSSSSSGASNTFQLKIYQGYDFKNKRVIDYGNTPSSVDFKFYFQQRSPISDLDKSRNGIYVYLGAPKIREFNTAPTSLSSAQVNGWDNWTLYPVPGKYYVVKSRDGQYYLLHLLKYENQGKAAAYWLMTFEWKKISVS